MEEEGADDVSRPEKTPCLWLKALLPLQPCANPPIPLPPQNRQLIRAGEEVPFWKHKQVSDSHGSRVNRRTSSSVHLLLLQVYIESHTGTRPLR